MRLNELFQPGSKSASPFDVLDRGNHHAVYGFTVDDHGFQVVFEDQGNGLWDLSFLYDDFQGEVTQDIMNLGSDIAIRVFATVAEILRSFVGMTPTVERITFSAKEPSRQKLYDRIAKKLDPVYQSAKSGEYKIYTIQVRK